jgi:hypothetical protein
MERCCSLHSGAVKIPLGARLFDTEEKAEEHAAYGVRVLWLLSILRSKANEFT